MTRRTESERFWAKVNFEGDDGCWLWTAAQYRHGYGYFTVGYPGPQTTICAHRYAYIAAVGPIPEGMDLDHLCRVRLCVNPDHLEPVTRQVNLRRMQESLGIGVFLTHCKHGHEFTEANTYYRPDRPWVSRMCRTCRYDAGQRMYARRRDARWAGHVADVSTTTKAAS